MKVSIYIEPAFGTLSFLFYNDQLKKRYVVKPVDLQFEEHDETKPPQPTLTIPYPEATEFLQNIVDYAYEHGIKPSQEPVLGNELKATQYHLEDMRQLVFEEKEIRKEIRIERRSNHEKR